MRNQKREDAAKCAAAFVKEFCQKAAGQFEGSAIGLVLGTGWGDVLKLEKAVRIPFKEIPGFDALEQLEGHARELVIGKLAGKNVCVLRGRIHMNEAPCDPEIAKMVRLQTEMLFQLGVKDLVITSAVGALPRLTPRLGVGDICVVNGFITVFAPEMPLWAGEFVSPEDVLDDGLQRIALMECGQLTARCGGYVMVRGPFFEGRKFDKDFLSSTGASVVGMSMLPEACVAALYKGNGARVLGLAFVTNDAVQEHSHEENLACAGAASKHLGGLLERIVSKL